MRNLQEIREEMDALDQEMVRLYQKRIRLCEDVAEYKILTGKPILDRQREEEKLRTLSDLADTEFDKNAIVELYKQIMAISRRYQYAYINRKKESRFNFLEVEDICKVGDDIKVAYQGASGAYQEIAARKFFERVCQPSLQSIPTFEETIDAVLHQDVDFAVIPIENSSAGQVSDTYDLLAGKEVYIVGEICIPIRHALLGVRGALMSDIKTVYSHAQGLMQCQEFLKQNNFVGVSYPNTALSAKKIQEEKDASQAAIASLLSASVYDLDVLQENINDVDINTTRFVVLSARQMFSSDATKISIVFSIPHKHGSLYDILGNIMFNGLNMLKIESRPIKEREWEYRFFVDIEGNLNDPGVMNALDAIRMEVGEFRILGCY